jgi:hypothetical protein
MLRGAIAVTSLALIIPSLFGCSSEGSTDRTLHDKNAGILTSIEQSCQVCDELDVLFHTGGEQNTIPLHFEDPAQLAQIIRKIEFKSARECTLSGKLAAKPVIEIVANRKSKELVRFEIVGDYLFVKHGERQRRYRLKSFEAWSYLCKLGGL